VRTFRLLALTTVVLLGSGLPSAVAGADTPVTTGTNGTPTTTAAPPTSGTAPSPWPSTAWLCRPGLAANPCTPDLTITRVSFTRGILGVTRATVARRPPVDCFYVYPTVSDQKTPNADLTIDPQEQSIARFQAAQFSRVCRVYAPMYRQLTLANIGGAATRAQQALAFGDVLTAWRTYLRQYNHGRGVVVIGHSQGAFLLRKLIATQIDPKASVRKLLVSAILLGGNVTVRKGSGTGGDFRHISACRSAGQTGCVIAYSTFGTVPPTDAVFGRTTAPGLQVLCTNPAALAGGSGLLDPILPTRPFAPGSSIAAGIGLLHFGIPPVTTPWVSAPGAYSARCSGADGANALVISPLGGAPQLHPSPLASWGLHLVDVNIAMGNLVGIVARESAGFHIAH
jgi:hypothetical protein